MRINTLLIVAFFSLTQNVNCNFFSDVKNQFDAFGRSISTGFHGVFKDIQNAFNPPVKRKKKESDPLSKKEKIKRSFHEYVEKMAAETRSDEEGWNGLNYASMRQEPTAFMSTPQLVALHGKTVESHVIQTRDGYLLTLHRLVHPNEEIMKNNQSVLFHHGLLGSSADWILLGPDESLPYILSDAGYDVWMANARGNYYSRGHVSRSLDSPQFWKFSFQEMGEYDLPAVIDFIRKMKNGTNEINYIGHSMGATALMVLLSTTPRYNQYLRMGILLAPLVFMNNIQGPFKILTTMSSKPPDGLLKIIGNTEFLPSRRIPRMITSKFCKGPNYYCSNPLLFFTGDQLDERQNASFTARLLYHVPSGGSTNTIMHYGQLVKSGKFHRFGKENSEFPLHQVTVPIVVFSSYDDWLAPVVDVLRLYFSVKNPVDHYVIRGHNMSHTGFVWGADAYRLVFLKVLEYLGSGLFQSMDEVNEV